MLRNLTEGHEGHEVISGGLMVLVVARVKWLRRSGGVGVILAARNVAKCFFDSGGVGGLGCCSCRNSVRRDAPVGRVASRSVGLLHHVLPGSCAYVLPIRHLALRRRNGYCHVASWTPHYLRIRCPDYRLKTSVFEHSRLGTMRTRPFHYLENVGPIATMCRLMQAPGMQYLEHS